MPLKEGTKSPVFSLLREDGSPVSSSDFAGRKLVLFFYPKAGTTGCTLEATDFSHLAPAFKKAGTALLGVSADPVKKLAAFKKKHDLKVPLASDESLAFLKACGVWVEKSMYGRAFMGTARTTVLIGADGRIVKIWSKVKVAGHAQDVLDAARAV